MSSYSSTLQHQKLTRREKEVLNLISLEYTTKEIATELYVSKATVDSHRKNLFSKMDVKNMAGLVRKAFELGFLSPSVAV